MAVSHNFASLYGVKVGDKITLPTPGRPMEAEVVALVTDYSWNRGTILMDRAHFREVFNDRQVDIFDLFLRPGADAGKVREDVPGEHHVGRGAGEGHAGDVVGRERQVRVGLLRPLDEGP